MRLSDLLQTIQPVRITGSTSMEITGVNIDSRLIGTGHLFMAMRGTQTDGHAYIPAAIDKGAVAVLCEELPEELKAGITYIQVKDSEDAVGKVATTFYGDPTSKMELIGRFRLQVCLHGSQFPFHCPKAHQRSEVCRRYFH